MNTVVVALKVHKLVAELDWEMVALLLCMGYGCDIYSFEKMLVK